MTSPDNTFPHRRAASVALWAAHAEEAEQLLEPALARLLNGTRTRETAMQSARKTVARALRAKYPDEWQAAFDAHTQERINAAIAKAQTTTAQTRPPLNPEERNALLYVCSRHLTDGARMIADMLGLLGAAA